MITSEPATTLQVVVIAGALLNSARYVHAVQFEAVVCLIGGLGAQGSAHKTSSKRYFTVIPDGS